LLIAKQRAQFAQEREQMVLLVRRECSDIIQVRREKERERERERKRERER
jgi:hypothetical protein